MACACQGGKTNIRPRLESNHAPPPPPPPAPEITVTVADEIYNTDVKTTTLMEYHVKEESVISFI